MCSSAMADPYERTVAELAVYKSVHYNFQLSYAHKIRNSCKGMEFLTGFFANLFQVGIKIKYIIKIDT